MEIVDLDHWPRKAQFDHFSSVSDPFYNITYTQDVTGLYRYVKSHGLSFYYALVYLVAKAVNEVEAFRYAIQDGRVVLLDERIPSFTDLKPGSEAFHIVTMPCRGTLEEFCTEARRKSLEQTVFLDQKSEGTSLLYLSCLPWVELTALTNEGVTDPDDTIPRIAWGKYRDEGGRKTLGLSLELNHRFIDGVHIGNFAAALTRMIDKL